MATQLKNIIAFTNVGIGAQQTVAHGLNIDGRGVTPDKLEFDNGDFSFVGADATNVTIQNDGTAIASCNVMAEHWLTVERTFGPVSVTTLTPQPFVVAGAGGGGGGGVAEFLGTTGADVNVGNAAPPAAGEVLKATSATTAVWLPDSGVSNPLVLQTGDGTVSAPAAYASGAIGHGIANGGTADVNVDPLANGMAWGWVDSYAGGTARVEAAGQGSFAHGRIDVDGAFSGILEATQPGAQAFGSVHALAANASIRSTLNGALAFGYADANTAAANIYAQGSGSFAGGFAYGIGGVPGLVRAQSPSSMAFGMAWAGNVRANAWGAVALGYGYSGGGDVYSSGAGALAAGCAVGTGSQVSSSSSGSHGFGYATGGGSAYASGKGAIGGGYAKGPNAQVGASGNGATGFGYADVPSGFGGVYAVGNGSLAAGYVLGASSVVWAQHRACVALGGAYDGGTVEATFPGATAIGYAYSSGLVEARGRGSFSQGFCRGSGAQIFTQGYGSFARGFVDDNGSQVTAGSPGALASGVARTGGDMLSSADGGMCMGEARDGSAIETNTGGHGCFAGGYAYDGSEISTAPNAKGCFAFGRARFDGDAGAGIRSAGSGCVAMGAESCGSNSANAQIYAQGTGSFAVGRAFNNSLGNLYSSVNANGSGAFAQGFANQVGIIAATGDGASAGGYVESAHITVGTPATVEATALGSFAHGKAQRTADGNATVRASGNGAWAGGSSNNYGTYPGLIEATNPGAMALGFASGGRLQAGAQGATAFGYVYDEGRIYAKDKGAFIAGHARGKNASRYSYMYANGPGSMTFGYVYSGGYMYSNGKGCGAFGVVKNQGKTRATGTGAFAFGAAGAPGPSPSEGEIQSVGQGSFAAGYSYGNDSVLQSRSTGSIAMGYCWNGGTIEAAWGGSVCIGSAFGSGAQLRDNNGGGFCLGWASTGGRIRSNGLGAHAHGYAYGAGSYVRALATGSFSSGYAKGGSLITTTGRGARAGGYAAASYDITASAHGSFAFGNAAAAGIYATAVNAVQFGPGTNAVANSLQVGTDFLAKANGQFGGKNDALTLGAGVTTFVATSNVMTITGDAGANTIATITGGIDGQELILIFVDANVTITDDNTHAANTVDLSAAFTSADDTVLKLVFDGTSWYEVSRSVN
jgi:hypothetical protein